MWSILTLNGYISEINVNENINYPTKFIYRNLVQNLLHPPISLFLPLKYFSYPWLNELIFCEALRRVPIYEVGIILRLLKKKKKNFLFFLSFVQPLSHVSSTAVTSQLSSHTHSTSLSLHPHPIPWKTEKSDEIIPTTFTKSINGSASVLGLRQNP